jgi:DNA-binding Lrp family transcriptional regulator
VENTLKSPDLKLIRELIRNSRKSDRELAKLLGVSQPTVSRNRDRLEKEGLIEYTGVPNLQKLGIEIIAFTFGNWKHEQYPDTRVSEAKDFAKRHPNLIFLSSGRGLNSDRVAVSVHRDYSDYSKLMREVKSDWGKFMDVTGSFLISLSSDDPLRSITFKHLADYLEEKKS